MRSQKIFISGRVTGLTRQEAERNFNRGVKMLMQNTYDYVNPLDLIPEGADNREAMKILLPVLTECDGILLLNDHKQSEGSHIEKNLARYCGLQLFYEDDLSN
jgi:hypothetical protein